MRASYMNEDDQQNEKYSGSFAYMQSESRIQDEEGQYSVVHIGYGDIVWLPRLYILQKVYF